MDFDSRPAAYVVVVYEGKILLPYWKETGADGRVHEGWTLPGGGIELGEHPAEAAVREAFEETGYQVRLDGILGFDTILVDAANRFEPSDKPQMGVRIIFEASVIGGELRAEENGTTTHAKWVDLDQVPQLKTVSLVRVGLQLHRQRPVDGEL